MENRAPAGAKQFFLSPFQGSLLFASIPGARKKSTRPRLIVLGSSGASSLDSGFAAISAGRPHGSGSGKCGIRRLAGRGVNVPLVEFDLADTKWGKERRSYNLGACSRM